MSKTAAILRKVHFSVHYLEDVKPNKKFSIGLYTGSMDASRWSTLKRSEQQAALKKGWYLRWSYRNPETGKVERQDNIKVGVNWYKTKAERLEILKTLQRNLESLLKDGYSPYDEDSEMAEIRSVEEAIAFGLNIKKEMLGRTYFNNFKSCIKRFEKYLIESGYRNRFISSVDKKIVNQYLNHVLQASSARNRNNTRADIRNGII